MVLYHLRIVITDAVSNLAETKWLALGATQNSERVAYNLKRLGI